MGNCQWNLNEIYEGDEGFEREFARFSKDIEHIAHWKGKLKDQEAIRNFILEEEALSCRADRLYVYAQMKYDLNTKDSGAQGMNSRVTQLLAKFAMLRSYAIPELLELDEEFLRSVVQEEGMERFKHGLDDLLRRKKYTLSGELENLLAMTLQFSDAASSAYGALVSADMVYPDVTDSEGKSHTLTQGTFGKHLQSPDRTLRKDAFFKMHQAYEEKVNTIASLMESEVKKNIFYAKARGHESARHAALFENNVSVSVMDRLIDAVHANLPLIYRAFELRKKLLGLDELHLYDTYVSIADCEYKIDYEEAKALVKEAVRVYGEDYARVAAGGLDGGWVDVYEREGKRGGAYSGGAYDTAPYILMNYNDTLNSAFTLIHELGHSMHSYYSRKNQGWANANYSIFVAEVASTCNECLLNDYLLKTEKDSERRKYILGHFIDDFRATVYRQTMFAEFERDIHAHVEEGGALTAEYLCEHYLELVKLYFGPDVVVDDVVKYEWARIPHFYYNFYVYQYATGFSAAVALSDQVLSGNPTGALEFLASGGSDYPIRILRKAGIEMETDVTVNRALSVFGNLVEEFERLM